MLRQEEHVPAVGERERGKTRLEICQVKYSTVLYSSHRKARELNNVLFAVDV